MDVVEQISAGLPETVDELADDDRDVDELWLLARSYSRLRHRARGHAARRRLEALKTYCIRLVLARDPELFFVFVDPGMRHLWLIYHRHERNLLHVPVTTELWEAPS